MGNLGKFDAMGKENAKYENARGHGSVKRKTKNVKLRNSTVFRF